MTSSDLDDTIAHHEAGHIVASRRFGLPLMGVSMSPTNETNFAESVGLQRDLARA